MNQTEERMVPDDVENARREKMEREALEAAERQAMERAQQAQQAQPQTRDVVLRELADLAADYDYELKKRRVSKDLRQTLVRDYHALAVAAFLGLSGITLPAVNRED